MYNRIYVAGACAIYVDEKGLVHAVENFKMNGPVVLPNGQVQGVIYPDDPSTYERTWTASNGVTILLFSTLNDALFFTLNGAVSA